jgi:hypothetical protein
LAEDGMALGLLAVLGVAGAGLVTWAVASYRAGRRVYGRWP